MKVKVLVSQEFVVDIGINDCGHTFKDLEEYASNKVKNQMESMLLHKLIRPEYFRYDVKF